MDLSTNYMGMELKTPFVVSAAQPLSQDLGIVRRIEDAGASALVLYSLFEEQLEYERRELQNTLSENTDSFAEALSFFPEPGELRAGSEAYLNHIRKVKEAVKIPVIASLNGSSSGGWTEFARQMEQAGADALELNVYNIPTEIDLSSSEIERGYVEILQQVKSEVRIPVAVKLSPFFTNTAYMAKKLSDEGADALVLFNRFYQPDIDIERLEVRPDVILSNPFSLRLPMRWIAILYGRIRADLAGTSGIHRAEDAVKMLMAGANVTMLCSALLIHGIDHLKVLEANFREWMAKHDYQSVNEMRGSVSQQNCGDPSAFERAQYIRLLHSYQAK